MILTAKNPKHVNRKTARVLPARSRCKGWRVIQERDGNNAPLVSYTRGTDLSGSLEGAGGIGGLLARSHNYISGNWVTHNYYHADGNGNIMYLVNGIQTLAASYRYDAYGNTISSSGVLASANVYRFSSKEVHASSGLYYYGYRWYAPNLQRWLNRDPIFERGGENLYCFLNNSPNGRIDHFGLAGGPIGVPPLTIGDITHAISEVTRCVGLGGTFCNFSGSDTWYVDNGEWHSLSSGQCTDFTTDADGFWCGGQFSPIGFASANGCGPDNRPVFPVEPMPIPNDRAPTLPPIPPPPIHLVPPGTPSLGTPPISYN
jgi:RHS repeat-associated protein